MKKLQKFETIMDELARRHGVHSVFSDFLTLLICAFSHGKMEEQYFRTIRKYEKPEEYTISEALAALVIQMTGPDGNGMVNILGEYFEQHLSFGKNGQFFTPQPICDMMACINSPSKPTDRILDPACGSGRMLMAMAKINRFGRFYGADNDRNCAMMATINLCLNGMYGEVSWMNSLTNQYYGGWEIFPSIKGCPCIRPITEKQSVIHLKLPASNSLSPSLEGEAQQAKILNVPPSQQLIFEF